MVGWREVGRYIAALQVDERTEGVSLLAKSVVEMQNIQRLKCRLREKLTPT